MLPHLPGHSRYFLLHTNASAGTLTAAQPTPFTVIKISLIVSLLVHSYSAVRTEEIANTTFNTLILIPHRFTVSPVLVVVKFFSNGKLYHLFLSSMDSMGIYFYARHTSSSSHNKKYLFPYHRNEKSQSIFT